MSGKTARQTIKRLHAIRNLYGRDEAAEKLALLDALGGLETRSAPDLKLFHLTLCFLRAFPDNRRVLNSVTAELDGFTSRVARLGERERERLVDTGIAGTRLHYPFSYEVAAWLARAFPGAAAIDWAAFDEPARFEELLEHILHHSETDYYDSGRISTRDWVTLAAEHRPGSDVDWLMAELYDRRHHARFWTSLYNAAELPLVCRLAETSLSRTRNVYRSNNSIEALLHLQSRNVSNVYSV